MKNKFILIFTSIIIQGCSQLLWIKYLEPAPISQWQTSGSISPQRRSVYFEQPCYAFVRDSLSVRICPEVLDDFLISFGPPYVPIVPFIPGYLLLHERPVALQLTLADSSNSCIFDLREVSVCINSIQSLTPTKITIERIDSLHRIHWDLIDGNSRDTSMFFIPISTERTRLRYVFDIFPSDFDSLAIIIQGLSKTTGIPSTIPRLHLIRKGRLLYESMSAA
jgi:hypothetical protein